MENLGNYELLFIVHPDLESSIDKTLDRVRSYVDKRDGKIIYEENWGKRKLAYEINKTDVGIYVLWFLNVPKNKVASIEKDLRINEEVMRYMLLVAEEKKEVKPKVKKEVVTEEGVKAEAKTAKKVAPKETKAAEKERMKEIDEKLEKLLGDEEPKK